MTTATQTSVARLCDKVGAVTGLRLDDRLRHSRISYDGGPVPRSRAI